MTKIILIYHLVRFRSDYAALAGVRQRVNYEGQAAIEFEALADKAEAQSYPFPLELAQVGGRAAFESLIKDVLVKIPSQESLQSSMIDCQI